MHSAKLQGCLARSSKLDAELGNSANLAKLKMGFITSAKLELRVGELNEVEEGY